jgi:hypothetical protein
MKMKGKENMNIKNLFNLAEKIVLLGITFMIAAFRVAVIILVAVLRLELAIFSAALSKIEDVVLKKKEKKEAVADVKQEQVKKDGNIEVRYFSSKTNREAS